MCYINNKTTLLNDLLKPLKKMLRYFRGKKKLHGLLSSPLL